MTRFTVQAYVDDLRSLLAKSSITEQKSFLKSLVARIEVDESEAIVYYTIPCLRTVSPRKPRHGYHLGRSTDNDEEGAKLTGAAEHIKLGEMRWQKRRKLS